MKTNDVAREFIDFILGEDGPDVLPHVTSEISRLSSEVRREHTIQVISAIELTKEELGFLKEKLSKIFKKNFERVDTMIDARVLGGLKIQIGDFLIDATVQNQLKRIKNDLLL